MNKLPTMRVQRGMTLMELLIVVVIVGILAAVGYPSYTQFVVKSKRASAKSMLMQVADRQQQFFMDNKQYAGSLTDLGFPADQIGISAESEILGATDADTIYQVSLTNAAATSYTVSAAPYGAQASQDSKCGTLTYNQAGVKGAGGSVSDCW